MTEEVGVVESPQQDNINVSEASTDDLRGMMAETEPSEVAQPGLPETGELETPVETVEEAPLEEAYDTEETEEERLSKRRIRPRSALDQQVLDLYKSQAFEGSFADAANVIYQQQATQTNEPARATEDPRPDPTARYDERISILSQEVAELEIKVDEAADNLETAEALKLQREITRRELEVQNLSTAKNSEIQRRRDAEHTTHRNKAMESRDKALAMYPELHNTDSVVRKQFDEYVRQAQNDPDFSSVFKSPRWPEIMVKEFAYAMAPEATEEQQAPSQQQAPAMGTQAKVLTTGTTTQPANAPVTEQQVAANMGQMSNDQLYALLGQDDGRRAPLR